jgi:hypothetical protein
VAGEQRRRRVDVPGAQCGAEAVDGFVRRVLPHGSPR